MFLGGCPCCGKKGPPCDVCAQGYRVSGYPFSQYVCENGELLQPGFLYPNLFIEGDIAQTVKVSLLENERILHLVGAENEGLVSVTAVGYCNSGKGDPCRHAYADMTLKPFPAAVLPDGNTYDMGELVLHWNNGNPASASISGVGPSRNDETQANCYLILRSISLGGISVEQPIGVTPFIDEIGTLWLYAENGQDSQPYISMCVPPENWTGPLTVTAELWSYGTYGLPPVYTLLDTKVFNINWPEMINVAADCPVEPCKVLPVSSCFYKDYIFECKQYINDGEKAEIESNGWVKEFNRSLFESSMPALRCDTFYGQQVGCGACCGGENPSLDDGIIGHTLFNRIEQNPVTVGDGFPGQITGSLVDGLTALTCVSSTPNEIVFEDSPAARYACNEYQWEECPPFGGPCVDVDGYACFFLDPYKPNNPNDSGVKFDSCEECRASCGEPMWPGDGENLCKGSFAEQALVGYTAKIVLDQKCRASSTELSFPDIRPFYNDGQPENFFPSLLNVKINRQGVLIQSPQPSIGIGPVQIAATFGGVTVGGRPIESSLTTIDFRYCPLDAYGLVENPDALRAFRYIPQDDFNGPLSITLTDYRASVDGSQYTVTIDIDGAYDSYCWLCGKDLFDQPLVPKPTNEPVYDAGNNATPANVPLESNRTMPTTTTGPGTELANLLRMIGINPKEKGCQCKSHAKRMDKEGPQWCRENIETILGWLQTESKKRKLPFVKQVAKQVVLLAIRRSEKKS